jgi:hypothetical protein
VTRSCGEVLGLEAVEDAEPGELDLTLRVRPGRAVAAPVGAELETLPSQARFAPDPSSHPVRRAVREAPGEFLHGKYSGRLGRFDARIAPTAGMRVQRRVSPLPTRWHRTPLARLEADLGLASRNQLYRAR